MKELYDERGRKIGHIEDDGTIRNNEGLFGQKVGRIEEDGTIRNNEGLFGQKIGSIDDSGNIRNNEGLFGQKIGSIDDSGNIRNNEGLFGQKVGRVVDKGGKKNTGGGGVPIPSGSGPLEWIFGIIALYLCYILFKVISAIVKGTVFYLNAMMWLVTETSAGWIALASIVAFIILLKYIDVISVNANCSATAKSTNFWNKIHQVIQGKFLLCIVLALLIGWGTLSLIALQSYIPLEEGSYGSIEEEVFSRERIKTYRDYMNKLNNTSWYSDSYNISFSYTPIPNETGYLTDGDATVNGESQKFYFDVDSLNNDEGYSYGYVLYKGDIDDGDATYLFYDEYTDTFYNNTFELERLHPNAVEELKWALIKWKREGGGVYNIIFHFGNLTTAAKFLFIGLIIAILFFISLPIMLRRRNSKIIGDRKKREKDLSIIREWLSNEYLKCERKTKRIDTNKVIFSFSIYNSTEFSFDKLEFELDVRAKKTKEKLSGKKVVVNNWSCSERYEFEEEICVHGEKDIVIALLSNTIHAKYRSNI